MLLGVYRTRLLACNGIYLISLQEQAVRRGVKNVIVHKSSLKQRTPVVAERIDFSLQIIRRCMEKRREAVKAHEAADMASQEALIKPYNVDAYGLIASTALCLPDTPGGYRVIAQAPAEALMALGAMPAFITDVHRFARKNDTAVRTVGGALLACDTAGRAAETLFQKLYKCPVGLSCRRLKSLFCLLKSKYALFAPGKGAYRGLMRSAARRWS